MPRDKQIEEMKNRLCDVLDFNYDDERGVTKVNAKTTAEGLYTAGYRKASDVAREIFEEIESKKLFVRDRVGNMRVVVLFEDIAELKKKYTENKGE